MLLYFSGYVQKYPRGRRGSPAKGVGRVKSVAEVQILSSAPRKARENIAFSLAFLFFKAALIEISGTTFIFRSFLFVLPVV